MKSWSRFVIAPILAVLAADTLYAQATSPATEEQLRKDVAAMYQEDVPWRKIAWKTCLLDGLSASREQGKPVVLWVFIDRPIDDERC